jgi:hypothetical protein
VPCWQASNAWATLASDRELHREEVHKLTAIIRQFDEEKRGLGLVSAGRRSSHPWCMCY